MLYVYYRAPHVLFRGVCYWRRCGQEPGGLKIHPGEKRMPLPARRRLLKGFSASRHRVPGLRSSETVPTPGPRGAGAAGPAPSPRPPPRRSPASPRGGRSSSRRRGAVPASPGPRTHPPALPGASSVPVPRGCPYLRARLAPWPQDRTAPGGGRDRLMLPCSLPVTGGREVRRGRERERPRRCPSVRPSLGGAGAVPRPRRGRGLQGVGSL